MGRAVAIEWHCECTWEQEVGRNISVQSSQVVGVFSMRPANTCQEGIGCMHMDIGWHMHIEWVHMDTSVHMCMSVWMSERASEPLCILQSSDAQLLTALTAARTDLDWVVSEIKAGKLSQQEAEECVQQVSDSVPSITAAAAAVQRAKSRGQQDVWGLESARVKAGAEGWTPKVDEPVRLIKLGGKTGKVLHLHTSSL